MRTDLPENATDSESPGYGACKKPWRNLLTNNSQRPARSESLRDATMI